MDGLEGATLAVVVVAAIVLIIFWLWVSWVAIGLLMVWWAMPADLFLHGFLWIAANTAISKAGRI